MHFMPEIKYSLTPVQFGTIFQVVAQAIVKHPCSSPDLTKVVSEFPIEKKKWEQEVTEFYQTHKNKLPSEDVFWDLVDLAVNTYLKFEIEE
jgi:hypothetical protein